jgi:pimeloyl-ACP methyl ester carboxylesterase
LTPVRPPPPARDLPPAPTLLLAGDRDLSTPLEWAREEAAHAPRGRLIVVRGSGHSVQSQAPPPVRRAIATFLR